MRPVSDQPWPPPGVYVLPAERPFLDTLVRALLTLEGKELARARLLLPSRRACALVRARFAAEANGRALLLPRIEPVGELAAEEGIAAPWGEPVPEAVPPLVRQLLLSRLVTATGLGMEQAVRYAGALASLLDELATEEVALDRLERLVPEELAVHWQQTLAFLRILKDQWPKVLAERGAVEPAERRRLVIEAQIRHWQQAPPQHLVIAAGITGTVPAVARLVAAVARLPRGYVILPGLDRELDEESWRAVLESPSHPQWALARLLRDHLRLERRDIPTFPSPGEPAGAARERLWREVMRPAATAGKWRELPPFDAATLQGLTLFEAADRGEEAVYIALRMREALEQPGRTAILITRNRHLARRVSAELARWGLNVDDSAGVPLDQTPPGTFLLHLAHAVLEGAPPVQLLALLKHPFARCGMAAGTFRGLARRFELRVLRGVRAAGGFEGLERKVGQPEVAAELKAWWRTLQTALAPLAACSSGARPLGALLAAHLEAAERLGRDEEGRILLWQGPAGQALERLVGELEEAARALPEPVEPALYPALLAHLMAQVTVRPAWGVHPRLAILGPMESRLLSADLVILGALEEGSWPAPRDSGPWLSRAMRAALGLPPVDQQVGFAAHDFVQAASAPEVVLTRSRRDEMGQLTVASRWWQRLEAVLQAAGWDAAKLEDRERRSWVEQLDRPDAYRPVPRPRPTPPRKARPARLTIGDVELLVNDPYRFYARRILGLAPLEPLGADPGAAERGRTVHAVLKRMTEEGLPGHPEQALERLLAWAKEEFGGFAAHPHLQLIWHARFARAAPALVAFVLARGGELEGAFAEQSAELVVPLGDGEAVEIAMRADRIERLKSGRCRIVDYKTGRLPEKSEVRLGRAPQLLLEALAAASGCFACLGKAEPVAVEYWHLSGGDPPFKPRTLEEAELAETLAAAETGLARLLGHFLLGETSPFEPIPRPGVAERHNPYAHLARVQEWWGSGET